MRFLTILISLMLICGVLLYAKKKVDPRLRDVNWIFVKGTNQAADKARDIMSEGKTCFSLAGNEGAADATLEVAVESKRISDHLSLAGGRHETVSFNLTLKSGDLVWWDTYRASGAMGMGGAKSAVDLLLHRLAKDAACKERKKSE